MADRRPYVTYVAVAAILAFAWRVTGFVPTEASLSPWWFSAETAASGEWYRLFTSVIAHGGPLHLAFNGFALASLAGLERRLGSLVYATVFVAAGVGGNLAQVAVGPTPVVGASGAIFGLLGVMLAVAPQTPLHVMGIVPVPAAVLLPGYAALVLLVPGLEQLAPIAHFAHLGGLVVGIAAGASLTPKRALENLAYAGTAFAGVGLLVLNVQAVGLGRIVEAASREGLGTLVGLAWPSLVGLALVGLVLYELPRRSAGVGGS